MKQETITVVGAGITGLWQALTLARAGHRVRLVDATPAAFTAAASRYAGAMLAPYCEAESSEPAVRKLGLMSLPLWLETYPQVVRNGTLVVAAARDRSELTRFARMTDSFETLSDAGIAALEPEFAGRFASGLFFAGEAHMAPVPAMVFLLAQAQGLGVDVKLGHEWQDDGRGIVVDCRGMAARAELPGLRGVRGERLILRTRDIALSRPVRLLHPRYPLYVVPWGDGAGRLGTAASGAQTYMVGATVIESEDDGPMTLRSALELLGMAYALHPAFGEAEIVDMGAGVRPAFADNVPGIVVRGRVIHVNGLYRHGFLTAPALAMLVAGYLADGTTRADVFRNA